MAKKNAKKQQEYVTPTEFARIVEVKKQSVFDAIKSGTRFVDSIKKEPNGRYKIEVTLGREEWVKNRNLDQAHRGLSKDHKILKENQQPLQFKGITVPPIAESQRINLYLNSESSYRDLLDKDFRLELTAGNLIEKDRISHEIFYVGANQRDLQKGLITELTRLLADRSLSETELREIIEEKIESTWIVFCEEMSRLLQKRVEDIQKSITEIEAKN